MSRRFKATSEKVAIYGGITPGIADDGPFNAPLDHLDRVVYHSDLEYLEIHSVTAISLSLPDRIGATTTGTLYDVTTHGLGYTPIAVMVADGVQYAAHEPRYLEQFRLRTLALVADDTTVKVREWWVNWFGSTVIPAETFAATVYVLKVAAQTEDEMVSISPAGVQLGRGIIAPGRKYVRESEAPDFYGARSRTIDTIGAGFRRARPDGTTSDILSYSGSFVATGVGLKG